MAAPGYVPKAQGHADAGLKSERTALAWTRTTLAIVAAAVICLRGTPHHGWFTAMLVTLAAGTALATHLMQKARYRRAVRGIANETMPAAAVLCMSASVVALGGLGIYTTLILPLQG